MGNLTAYLCPNTSSKFIAATRRARRLHQDSDTSHLVGEVPYPVLVPESTQEPKCSIVVEKSAAPTHGPKVTKGHVNFPFLTDDEVASWIVNTRFMFILRGPPGSGKSYLAECIRIRFPTAQLCSADDFWYLESDGLEYQFDPSRIAEAHQWCQSRAHDLAKSGDSPLVVDNTNVRAWETRFYTDLAKQYRYTVIMVTPQTPWRFDPNTLASKNVHFVGIQAIEAKVRNFEHVFPLYYGWQWPGIPSSANLVQQAERSGDAIRHFDDTQRMLRWSWDTWVTIVGIPDIRIQLAAAQGLSDDSSMETILRHWYSATQPKFGDFLKSSPAAYVPHITAMYSRFGRADGAHAYGISGAVSQSLLGQLFTVQVTGLFFSLRTVGLRIRLSQDDLVLHHLWRSDDQAIFVPPEWNDNGPMSESSAQSGVRPVGCRAHMTLAIAPGVSAVETGYDLLRVVDAELDGRSGEHVAIIPGGSVRRVTVAAPVVSPTSQRNRVLGLQFVTAPSGSEYIYVFDLDVPQYHRVLFAGVY